MARPNGKQEEHKHQVEEALFALSTTIDLQNEVGLRIQQAVRRSPLVGDVLDPAVERLVEANRNVLRAHGLLSWLWSRGQKEGWD